MGADGGVGEIVIGIFLYFIDLKAIRSTTKEVVMIERAFMALLALRSGKRSQVLLNLVKI